MKRGRNPCLGCGCNLASTTNSYCGFCEKNVCNDCGALGVKSDLCLNCREEKYRLLRNNVNL